jgi:hypothetical protein
MQQRRKEIDGQTVGTHGARLVLLLALLGRAHPEHVLENAVQNAADTERRLHDVGHIAARCRHTPAFRPSTTDMKKKNMDRKRRSKKDVTKHVLWTIFFSEMNLTISRVSVHVSPPTCTVAVLHTEKGNSTTK